MSKKKSKPTWEFELVLTGVRELTDETADAFHEAGCDDGTFGIVAGVPLIGFAREAETLTAAVLSERTVNLMQLGHALPIQSARASSRLSRMPMRRCSGVSTRNSPPSDQNACPPRKFAGS